MTEELRNGLRATDVIGRFGGDEFAVILPEARATDAVEIINRIRSRLADKRLTQTPQLGIRISVGVAEYRPTMNQYHDWLKAADIALYIWRKTKTVGAPKWPNRLTFMTCNGALTTAVSSADDRF